ITPEEKHALSAAQSQRTILRTWRPAIPHELLRRSAFPGFDELLAHDSAGPQSRSAVRERGTLPWSSPDSAPSASAAGRLHQGRLGRPEEMKVGLERRQASPVHVSYLDRGHRALPVPRFVL